jgi:hypothetical protein
MNSPPESPEETVDLAAISDRLERLESKLDGLRKFIFAFTPKPPKKKAS